MAWLTVVDAAMRVIEVAGGEITPDQILHWIGSGHPCPDHVRQSGRHIEIRDDELDRLARLWGKGGKAYLPLWRNGERWWSTAFIAEEVLHITRHEVSKLGRFGRLEKLPVGYRSYIRESSVLALLVRDPWRREGVSELGQFILAEQGRSPSRLLVSHAIVFKQGNS